MKPRAIEHYVDGHHVGGGARFEVHNPVDGSLVATVCEAGDTVVNEAVAAARRALTGSWAELSAAGRAQLLRAVSAGIERRFDDFVDAEIADTGKPVSQARTLDIPRGAANFNFFANLSESVGGDCFETATPDGRG
ncbi:MAG: aldehyde dehydrogenase family protein, partial [Pseudomonadota bacterium]